MACQPGEILFAKYRIDALIGQGAFGEVYRVRHLQLDVTRALKVLRRDGPGVGSAEFYSGQERFRLEGQLGAKLNNPTQNSHLLQVYDLISQDHVLALEMEYASGGSLKERIQQTKDGGPPIALDVVLQTAVEVAYGMAAMHAFDVVHRDLKPANILYDHQAHARLADLGLAQIPGGGSMRSQLSTPAPHPGTPGYMSPEQASPGTYLTSASDVYSLGLTVFEMLTGRVYSVLRPGTAPSKFRSEIPLAIDDLLARMLSLSPKERPWDGEEAAGELLKVLGSLRGNPTGGAVQGEPVAGMDRIPQLETTEKVDTGKEDQGIHPEPEKPGEQAVSIVDAVVTEEKEKPVHKQSIFLCPDVEIELCWVPAGEFLMGSDPQRDPRSKKDEIPQHKIGLDEYWIGKFPITNRQYHAFIAASGYKPPEYWRKGVIPIGKDHHPVVGVCWEDAAAFCFWASKVSGQLVRLPTEAEWEKSARGSDGRLYPWGEQSPSRDLANYNNFQNGTSEVGQFPLGASPFGVLDLAGNVWEWVADWYADNYDGRVGLLNPTGPVSGTLRVMRGGSWGSKEAFLRSADRIGNLATGWNDNFGFRCALSSPSSRVPEGIPDATSNSNWGGGIGYSFFPFG